MDLHNTKNTGSKVKSLKGSIFFKSSILEDDKSSNIALYEVSCQVASQ